MLCNLCPRPCGAERLPDKAGGVCAMPAWPVAARAMLHQWEEPCLVGSHGAGAVLFSGCNLRCKVCQNGIISQEGYGTEYMCLYTADGFTGTMKECDEGKLKWIPKDEIWNLRLWEGDKIFLKLLNEDVPFFSLKLSYKGDELVETVLDGRPLESQSY